MSAVYSIGVAPQAIGQGFQADVTLYNQGPDIVWVDDSTAVSPVNGYPIYPGDSLTWQADKLLYAVARKLVIDVGTSVSADEDFSGTARLQVTDAGNILIPEATRVSTLVAKQTLPATPPLGSTSRFGRINVSRYDSVIISYTGNPTDATLGPDNMLIHVSWHSEDGKYLGNDNYWGRVSLENRLTIDVRGTYMTLEVQSYNGDLTVEETTLQFQVLGSTKRLDPVWYFTPVAWLVGNTFVYGSTDPNGATYWPSGSLTGAPADSRTRFFVPALSTMCRIQYAMSAALGAANTLNSMALVQQASNEIIFDTVTVPAGTTTTMTDLALNVGTTPHIRQTGSTVPTFVTRFTVLYL